MHRGSVTAGTCLHPRSKVRRTARPPVRESLALRHTRLSATVHLRPLRSWTDSRVNFLLQRACVLVLLVGVANFWGFSSPNAFPKCCSIVEVDALPDRLPDPLRPVLDVRRLLSSIPYGSAGSAPSSWIIDPDRRVEFVIGTGGGDCATKSRALARVLQRSSIPYDLVFIMDASEAETGAGHTVVECPVELDASRGLAVVDMLNAAVPSIDGRFLSVDDLLQHRALGVELEPLHQGCRVDGRYYGDSLSRSVIGLSRCEELNRYFDFMASAYVPLGSERLEKVVFILSALVLGVYPDVYMTSEDVRRLDDWLRFEITLAHAMIWAARLLVTLVAADVAARVFLLAAKRTRPAS